MENPWCKSEIYFEGLPVRCDLDLGHGPLHSHTDVHDFSPDGGETIINRDGAHVVVMWTEKTPPLTKSEKGDLPQEKIQITVSCPTCQTQHVQDTVTGDSTRFSYCPPCRESRRAQPPDWMRSGRHG
jgi:hypothetical protein